MYKGEAYLHEDRIDSVIRTAELLQIKGLCETEKKIVLNDNTNLRGSSSLGKFKFLNEILSEVDKVGKKLDLMFGPMFETFYFLILVRKRR